MNKLKLMVVVLLGAMVLLFSLALMPPLTTAPMGVVEADDGGNNVTPPAVVTEEAINISFTVAMLKGNITSTGGEDCDQRGFEWGETESYGNDWIQNGSYDIGDFSHTITGLKSNTTYHFRAKAHNSAGWGYGADREMSTPPSLLGKYAPVLYLHPEEDYYPVSIYSMLNESNLMLWDETTAQGVLTPAKPTLENLSVYNSTSIYLDLPRSEPCSLRIDVPVGSLPADLPEPYKFGRYNLTIYGRQVEKTYNGTVYIVLQYWFFYPYNKWYNCHEGDWERIQIIYDKATETPQKVTFGHHDGGDTYNWGDVGVSLVAETHPVVFVGLGSHSSWATKGVHGILPLSSEYLADYTSQWGTALFPEDIDSSVVEGVDKQPYMLEDISDEPSWVKWQGRWGQFVPGPLDGRGAAGVNSPANVVINGINVWNDPIAWAYSPGSGVGL